MASRQISELDLDQPDIACAWLIAFNARSRAKGWQDDKSTGYKITDNFLATCGVRALQKIQFIVAPDKPENMTFSKIEEALKEYLQPKKKLIIAERTRFHLLRQKPGETVANFTLRLRQGSQHCEFDELKNSKSPCEDMMVVGLVAGLYDAKIKEMVLDRIQALDGKCSVAKVQEFVQQFEERHTFVQEKEDENATIHFTRTNRREARRETPTNIMKNCKYCGKNHPVRRCPAYGKTCSSCKKPNHLAAVCRSTSAYHVTDNSDEDICFVTAEINSVNDQKIALQINGKSMVMQIDTGASVTVISSRMWKAMGRPCLRKSSRRMEVYDGRCLKVCGKFVATLEKDSRFFPAELIVVESEKEFGLLGRDLIDKDDDEIVHHTSSGEAEFLPAIKGVTASMELLDGAKDVFCRARPVPLALEEMVSTELDRLERRGIISKLHSGSSNASPVVWVRKRNGGLRMCVDFKAHVNAKIKTFSFPTPPIETIFSKLKNAKKFAKVDLTEAYSQIMLDDDARSQSVINTTKGLYLVNRLQMGMKNSQAIFQKTMESIVADLKGIIVYHDDILVFAENELSLRKRLEALKTRLVEKKVSVNLSKSIDYADEVTYLGFKVSARGIEPDDSLVSRIKAIEVPQSRKELEYFIGLANYFGRLVPNFAEKLLPLTKLRCKDRKFIWDASCSNAFDRIKEEISSSPVVQPYSLQKEATLTTDASKEALGACLSQESHPVIYISRRLTPAERNYSNIEREALAIVWAVSRLKQFLLGRQFCVETDHKPLVPLFSKTSSIPTGTSARICRWALQLMSYDYSIKYVPGEDLPHADALSRLRFKGEEDADMNQVAAFINCVEFEGKLLDPEEVRLELKEPFMSRILERVKKGWWSNCTQAEKPFLRVSGRLTIENGILYRGTRVFVPLRLRKRAFQISHGDAHSGIHSSIRRLKISAWWPGMDSDIERFVRQCEVCGRNKFRGQTSVHKWPSSAPFERLHMDWADIPSVGNVLIIVDAGSGWMEAFPTKDRTSGTVIKCLRAVFTRFGIPVVLVSDNAKEFVSQELNLWLERQGVSKMESPPYFPQANGIAERAVRTVKDALGTWKESVYHKDFNTFLQRILFNHRVSSHSRGKSPAEVVFGRQLRVPVVSQFQQGERVLYRPSKDSSPRAAVFLMAKGRNTSWLLDRSKLRLASNNQVSSGVEGEPALAVEAEVQCGPEDSVEAESAESGEEEVSSIPGDAGVHHRRSGRRRQEPQRWGYGEGFRPVDS